MDQSAQNMECEVLGTQIEFNGVHGALPTVVSEAPSEALSAVICEVPSEGTSDGISLLNDITIPKEKSTVLPPGIKPKPTAQEAKAQIRLKLGDLLTGKGFQSLRRLLTKAENGELRDGDTLKLLDLLMKYSIGPVNTQEITGENGAPIQIQFSFGTNKPEADLYLQDVRRRAEQYTAQTQTPKALSDNRSSDAHVLSQAVDNSLPVSVLREDVNGQK